MCLRGNAFTLQFIFMNKIMIAKSQFQEINLHFSGDQFHTKGNGGAQYFCLWICFYLRLDLNVHYEKECHAVTKMGIKGSASPN